MSDTIITVIGHAVSVYRIVLPDFADISKIGDWMRLSIAGNLYKSGEVDLL